MILGLDMSTKKTGFSVFNNDVLVEFGKFKTSSDDTKERMKEIFNWVSLFIDKYTIERIVFEDVPVNTHSNIKTGKDLCILQGVVLGICFKYNIDYSLYNPSSWRTSAGTYNGTREGMKRDFQKQKSVELANSIFGLNLNYYKTDKKGQDSDDDIAEAILLVYAHNIKVK